MTTNSVKSALQSALSIDHAHAFGSVWDSEAAQAKQPSHFARDTFLSPAARHRKYAQRAASAPAGLPYAPMPTNMAHIAKSSVYGVVFGATALTGMLFLSALLSRDKMLINAIADKPLCAFGLFELLGTSAGAIFGALVGALEIGVQTGRPS